MPFIRIRVLRDLEGGPPTLGNYQIYSLNISNIALINYAWISWAYPFRSSPPSKLHWRPISSKASTKTTGSQNPLWFRRPEMANCLYCLVLQKHLLSKLPDLRSCQHFSAEAAQHLLQLPRCRLDTWLALLSAACLRLCIWKYLEPDTHSL